MTCSPAVSTCFWFCVVTQIWENSRLNKVKRFSYSRISEHEYDYESYKPPGWRYCINMWLFSGCLTMEHFLPTPKVMINIPSCSNLLFTFKWIFIEQWVFSIIENYLYGSGICFNYDDFFIMLWFNLRCSWSQYFAQNSARLRCSTATSSLSISCEFFSFQSSVSLFDSHL